MAVRATCACLLTRTGAAGTGEVLLGVKKRGFGQGRIVAPGGHLEPGESAEQACVREVAEEVGLVVDGGDLVAAGGVLFDFPDRPGWDLHVAVFRAQRFTGDAVESDELVPAWYPIGDLPWDEMWPDARHWLPPVLSGAAIEAAFTLSASGRIRTFHAEPRDVPRGT